MSETSIIESMLLVFTGMSTIILVLAIAWIALGVAAFVYSLICMGRTPSLARSLIGLGLAIFFGPLYWIYYYADGEYCRAPRD
jgi:hypothetical protein